MPSGPGAPFRHCLEVRQLQPVERAGIVVQAIQVLPVLPLDDAKERTEQRRLLL